MRERLIRKSYILQGFAVILMIAAIALGNRAANRHDGPMVILETIIFAVNLALFIWQSQVRSKLRSKE